MSEKSDSNTPFDELPIKVFKKICSYLSYGDLRVLTRSSKIFNDRIKEDPDIMKKLPLQLNQEHAKNLKEAKKVLSRNYSALDVYCENFDKTTALWLTSNYCSKVRVLKFSLMKFQSTDAKILRKAFMALHDLEDLEMHECTVLNYSPSLIAKIEPVLMKNLKHIYFKNAHISFLQYFNPPELQRLKIQGADYMESPTSILSFLAKTPQLTHLALSNLNFQHADEIKEGDFDSITAPIRNMSLSLLQKPFKGNLIKFMEKFVDTLEELDIGKAKDKLSDSFYSFVLSKMKKIKVLGMQLSDAPNSKEFYDSLDANINIEFLIIHDDSIGKKTKFNMLLSKLPNLNHLALYGTNVGKVSMKSIETQCKNLIKLDIFQVDDLSAFGDIHMPNLLDLSICSVSVGNPKGWRAFVNAFPNLEKFSLHVAKGAALKDKTFETLTTGLANIKHFVLGKGFKATKVKFDNMLVNCDHLKTVEVTAQSFVSKEDLLNEVKEEYKDEGLRFICYNQPELCKFMDCERYPDFWMLASPNGEEQEMHEDGEEIEIMQALFFFMQGDRRRRRRRNGQNANQVPARVEENAEEPREEEPPVVNYVDLD